MTKIHLTTNASYNFKAPNISEDANGVIEVVFPTQEVQTIAADDDAELAIKRAFTHVNLTVEDDLTLTGILGTDLKTGDMVMIAATATGDDRTLTFASNLGGKSISLTQDQEELILLVYTGTGFKFLAAGTGSNGADGNDGADGATFLSGAGVPDAGLGNNGDHYLNSTDGEVYLKTTGAWASVGNIKGATGAAGNDGADGATFLSGAGVPGAGFGNNGDHYLNTTDGEVYLKTTGAWASVGNIKGATGAEGPAYTPADNSIAVAKLVKGADDQNTYTLKSVNGTISWVQDGQ